ncbi:hypothetical protein LCGC14_2125160, partial [marine sediment metagenome]
MTDTNKSVESRQYQQDALRQEFIPVDIPTVTARQ